jgi:hypothetical protein
VPEQAALDFRQRQHACDAAFAFSIKKMRAMIEGTLDHALPTRAVEKGRLGMRKDISIPSCEIRLGKRPDKAFACRNGKGFGFKDG